MEKKYFIKMINEEISKFDFLGNDAYNKEEESVDLLKNEDFQKQFICDSLVNNKNIKVRVTEARVGGDWEEGNEASSLSLECFTEITYKYDINKEPIVFGLNFSSNNVKITIQATHDSGDWSKYIAPSGEASYSEIDWNSIDVELTTKDGDEIDFSAFKIAPFKIQNLFIREYTEHIIENKTIEVNMQKDNIQNIPYC
jgi:hypothetical protein